MICRSTIEVWYHQNTLQFASPSVTGYTLKKTFSCEEIAVKEQSGFNRPRKELQ